MIAIVTLACLIYVAPDLATLTMGLDGVVYASIAQQLAAGEGGFWALPFFDVVATRFVDHPPLGIWLQSLLFTFFGDPFWVERLFCVLMIVGVALALNHLLLTMAQPVSEATDNNLAWWALLLFFLVPVVTRTLKNNHLESMVVLVTLIAVACAWRNRDQIRWQVLVGVLCSVGFLIKGPVALFPLVAPLLIAWFIDRSLVQGIKNSFIAATTCLVLIEIVLLIPDAQSVMAAYFKSQVVASIEGTRVSSHGRGYLLEHLFRSLVVLAVAVSIVGLIQKQRPRWSREALVMFLIGLSASLPLLISGRHFRHYLLPAMPFFAIAAALLIQPKVAPNKNWLVGGLASLAVTLIVVTSINFGEKGKDGELLDELEQIALTATEQKTNTVGFCIPEPVRQSYLRRYSGIRSTTVDDFTAAEVWLCSEAPGDGAEKIAEYSDGLSLWQVQ